MKTHIYQYDEQKRVTHQTIYSDFYENRPYTETQIENTYNSNAQIEKVVALNGSTTYYYDQYGNDTLCVNTSKGTERTTYTYDKKGNILVKQTEYERHVYYY